MSVSPDILTGPRLKIERANRHIDELRQLTEPLAPSLYEITITEAGASAIEVRPTFYHLTYRPKQPIPETLAIIVGDAIHNLRSALDHLAGGIIRTLATPPSFKPYFPIHPDRKNLEADASLAAIEQALPGAKKLLLEKIRPASGPHETLWRFNDLSNLDKHNLIIPTVTVAEIANINLRTSSGAYRDLSVGNDAAKPIKIMRSNSPITIDSKFETAVEISFAEGAHPFKDESVIPTLFQIRDVVSETLNAFERLIRTQENPSG